MMSRLAVSAGQNLNMLFELLEKQGITVTSMRNKANRLEELFIRLVESRQKSA